MKRLSLPTALAAVLVVAACVDDAADPTSIGGGLDPDLLGPSLSVVDAVNGEGGNEHFRWLKPIVRSNKSGKSAKSGKSTKSGRFTGEADPDLYPTVVICERVDQGGGVIDCVDGEPPLATFERGSETTTRSGKSKKSNKSGKGVIVVDRDDHYLVQWSLKDHPPERDGQYRIKVLIGGSELGHADVIVLRKSEKRAYRVDDEDVLIPISDKGNFKIAFRLEVGVLESQFCDFDGDGDVADCDADQEVAGDGEDTQIQVTEEEGGDEVVAVITAPDAVFTDEDGVPIPNVVITAEVEIVPPSEDVLTDDDQEIPYFVEINTYPEDVYIDPEGPGVSVLVCQDEEALFDRGIDDPLHPQLILYKVGDNGVTRRLISTPAACVEPDPAPPEGFAGLLWRGVDGLRGLVGPQPVVARRRLHGGLNTKITRKESLDDAFSTVGAVLGPNADSTDAVFPAMGSVGSSVPITIQVGNALGEDFLFGGDTLDVQVFKGPNTGVPVTVVDEGGGMYTASYTPIDFGVDSISILLTRFDGTQLGHIGGSPGGSPYGLEIRCFAPSALAGVTVTLGATCATPGEVPTFDIAMDVVQPGGTILANAGTHIVENLVVNKPVTIGEFGGATAVIQNDTARQSFLVDGVASGMVTIQDLDFVNNAPGVNVGGERSASIRAKGTYDQVVVQNNTFTNLPTSSNSGVRSDTTSVPGATMLIQNNSFSGGRTGVVATGVRQDPGLVTQSVTVSGNDFAGHNTLGVQYQLAVNGDISENVLDDCGEAGCIRAFGGNVDVLDNEISDATPRPASPTYFHNAIRFGGGVVGSVSGNDIDGCGWGVCIQVARGAVAEVRNNTIVGNVADHTEAGIIGYGGSDPVAANNNPPTLIVTDNVITGVGNGPGTRNDDDYYAFFINGIMMRNATATEVSRNQITNASQGINAFQNGFILGGTDNTVDFVKTAVAGQQNAAVTLTDSDFTDWIFSIGDWDGTLSGSVACNWWGDLTGPSNNVLNGGGIAFTPWTDGPVAGPATASCNPLPVPEVVYDGPEAYSVGSVDWVRYGFSVANWEAFDTGLFGPDPSLPPCGANTNAGRTWVHIYTGEGVLLNTFCALGMASDLNEIWFARPAGVEPPSEVYVEFWDRLTDRRVESNLVTGITAPMTLQPTDFCSDFTPASVATFADGILEAAVRNGLGLGPSADLTCALVSSPFTLPQILPGAGLASLMGAQNLTGITGMNFYANAVTDLGPLSTLSNLTVLETGSNPLNDLAPLAGLTGLQVLFASYTGISDTGPLAGLVNLNNLQLVGNAITDVSALQGLTTLGYLSLQDNAGLSDIQALLANTGLGAGDTVDLRGTGVSCTDVTALEAKGVNVTSDCVPCPAGAVVLSSQAEVDAFTCTAVTGNLTVTGADITNVDALSGLTSISGALLIESNPILADVDGLAGLTSIGAHMTIRQNPALTQIDGLASVTSVGGSFLNIEFNNVLTDLDGLAGLTSIGGGAIIQANAALTNVDGLAGITSMTQALFINENASLTNVDGLSSLTSVSGFALNIQGNPVLTDLDGLSALTSVSGRLVIYNNDGLTDIDGLSGLTAVSSNVQIELNDVLADVNGLSGLATPLSIGGDLTVSTNPALADCSTLVDLVVAGAVVGAVAINNNHAACSALAGGVSTDGVLSAGEWADAASMPLTVNLIGGGTAPGTLYWKNDANNLYLAVEFAATADNNSASFEFDDDHDGSGLEIGDDGIILNPALGFDDQVRYDCEGSLCGGSDTDQGGTIDGSAGFTNGGGNTVYEFSHPLDSGDANDFSRASWDPLGFKMSIRLLDESGFADTDLPLGGWKVIVVR